MNQEAEHLPKYIEVTREIRVTVSPEYLEESSSPEEDQYAFAYHVRIENLGSETVKLLERHWKIFSDGVQIGEVVGPGVVGFQPMLSEGEHFTYTSGAVIKDPVGYMEGVYTFRGQDEKLFDVVIPRFHLLCPTAVN